MRIVVMAGFIPAFAATAAAQRAKVTPHRSHAGEPCDLRGAIRAARAGAADA